jgi:hypothetical protein
MSRISEEVLACQSQYFFPIILLAQGFENPQQELLAVDVCGRSIANQILVPRLTQFQYFHFHFY